MIKKIELFGTTDVGQVRDHNEDNFAICKDLEQKVWAFKRDEVLELSKRGALLVVADGMGGTNAGEVASHIAQETIQQLFDKLDKIPESSSEREKILKKYIVDAHNAIVKHQHSNLETAGMGTTLVLAWVFEESVHTAWSGDSRVYLYQGQNEMYPFTDDHSLVWQMVQEGQMTPEEARTHPESNIITQSLGDERQTPKPSSKSKQLYKGDKVMVCSDGLCGMLSDQEILNFMQLESSTAEICKEMVNAANRAGGTDNITVLMLEVQEGDKRPASVTKEAIPSPKSSPSQPTTTQVLRKKNLNKNYIIAALLLIIAAVLVVTFMPDDDALSEVKVKIQEQEFTAGNNIELNLSELILDNAATKIDSANVLYKKKKLPIKNGILNFTPDTPKAGSVKIKLYPSNSTSFYTTEIKLKAVKDSTNNKGSQSEIRPAPASEQQAGDQPSSNTEEENNDTEDEGDSPNNEEPAGNETVVDSTKKPLDKNPIDNNTPPPLNKIKKPGEEPKEGEKKEEEPTNNEKGGNEEEGNENGGGLIF